MAIQTGTCLILTQVGMFTAPQGRVYYDALNKSAENKVIISGYVAAGTPGANLFDEDYCRKHGIKIKRARVIFKVHFDDDDVLALNETLQAKRIMLFHSPKSAVADLRNQLTSQKIKTYCLAPGKFIAIDKAE